MNTGLFPPPKRGGLFVHGLLLVALAGISSWGFSRLGGTAEGGDFVIDLLVGLLAFAPLPFLGYRSYALYRAQYRLDRDALELRWGLRDEVIPLNDIEWIRPIGDLAVPLRPPPLALPGAILGLRRHPDLGVVEFLASGLRGLLLVGTRRRVYAISPAKAADFLSTFARAVELGSLRESRPKSLYPSFVFALAWGSGLARYLWLLTLFLNVGLAAWTSLLIPSGSQFALGYGPDRSPDAVPSSQLVIIPLVSALLAFSGWIAGLFFYRWDKQKVLSFVLWTATALSSLLFLLAVLFIVATPV